MPRPSIALFLATAGLLAGATGCGKAPEPSQSPTPSTEQPSHGSGPAVKYHNERKAGEGGEGDEGGEGGEG